MDVRLRLNQSAPKDVIEFYCDKDQADKMKLVITHAGGQALASIEEKDRVYFKVEKREEDNVQK